MIIFIECVTRSIPLIEKFAKLLNRIIDGYMLTYICNYFEIHVGLLQFIFVHFQICQLNQFITKIADSYMYHEPQ